MLQLVMGLVGTGKSRALMQAMEQRAAAGQACVLLVPEQFSSSAEGLVYHTLGDALSGHVEVVSFRTLAERILKSCGGAGAPVLDEAGRVVFVRRALDAVGERLKAFARQRRSTAFCHLCAQTLAELKTAGATPGAVQAVALENGDDKLQEIALIFEAYEAVLAGAALDPEDRLALAAKKADCGWLAGKACYVDSFDGFTPPEYAMLEQLICHCEEVVVALCCDGLGTGRDELDLFAPVRRAGRQLQRLAKRLLVGVRAPQVLSELRRPKAAGLCAVNLLYAGQRPEDAKADGVYVTEAGDEWQEVQWAAAEMYRLAQQGMPYSRMALVCRDMSRYEAVVRQQLGLYNIPLFVDAATTVEYTPAVAFVRAALLLLRRGLGSDGVLALVKTGLCGFEDEAVAALENYVYTWQPKAAEWRQPFEKHPGGFLKREDENSRTQLRCAEALRGAVVPVLERFIRQAKGQTAKGLSKQLYLLMDHFGAPEQAEAQAQLLEGAGQQGYAEQARRAWDLAMDLLDRMALMLLDERVSADVYDELFLLMVRATDFGQVPQSLECVSFSGADRMRLASPLVCFVLGVCEGDFPMQVGYSGLLNHTDRDLLVKSGIEMPGSFENRTLLEEMFFYRALCAPRQGLYISWPRRQAGEVKSPSAALEPLMEALAPPALQPGAEQLAATPAAAFDLLGRAYRDNTPFAASLYRALEDLGDGEMGRALSLLQAVDNPGDFRVEDTAALRQLVGVQMKVSPTTAEQYHRCRFAYFLERVVKLRQRRRAEMSPMESGTFVHYILEQVLRAAGNRFAQMEDVELLGLARQHADAFTAENRLADSRRAAFQIARMTESCGQLLCFLRDAAAQSRFHIDALELPIGGEGGVPPLRVGAENGASIEVGGVVDRVDTLEMDGKTYLCIIDYKTGDKKLSLDEVYCGANMQMMIYLDALRRDAVRYPNAAPAGVLYLWSDPAPAAGDRNAPQASPYKLSGLLTNDAAVLQALDSGEKGRFIPVRFNKDGGISRTSPVADEAKFEAILEHVEGLLAAMAEGVQAGRFPARPLVKGQDSPCRYCPYRAACRHEDGVNETPVQAPDNAFEPPVAGEGEVTPV